MARCSDKGNKGNDGLRGDDGAVGDKGKKGIPGMRGDSFEYPYTEEFVPSYISDTHLEFKKGLDIEFIISIIVLIICILGV